MCFPLMAIFHSYVRLSLMGLTNSGMIALIASLKTMMMHMEGKHGLSEKGHKKLGCTEALKKTCSVAWEEVELEAEKTPSQHP